LGNEGKPLSFGNELIRTCREHSRIDGPVHISPGYHDRDSPAGYFRFLLYCRGYGRSSGAFADIMGAFEDHAHCRGNFVIRDLNDSIGPPAL
jgi:hypothetical protein